MLKFISFKSLTKNKILKFFFSLILLKVLLVLGIYIFYNIFKHKKVKVTLKEPTYYNVSFEEVNFLYRDTNLINFIKPFRESCNIFYKKKKNIVFTTQPYLVEIGDWHKVCDVFYKIKFTNNEDVINFIKDNFNIHLIKGQNKAKITGYYRIELDGSLKKNNEFKYPIYKFPSDLITVKLSDFSKDLTDIQVFGRVSNNTLIPYYNREEINKGVLENKNLELVWLNNKYSAFLLHVQGSGLINIRDHNKVMYLSYAGKNGHPFKGIYNYMKEKGYVKSTKLKGLDYFYDFFDKNPDKIDEVLNNNPSYIFFKEVNKESWYATFGTNPYDERTVAVDQNYIPLGIPLLVKMNNINKNDKGNEIVRLVVANDTGSAIKGPARIDFYWGMGDKAGYKASTTNHNGSLYLFLPKVVKN